MSVQFGRWNFDGKPSPTEYIDRAVRTIVPYGPDSENTYSKGGLTIIYRGFHTTKESREETQPHHSRSGAVITWDGRLDNRAELRQQIDRTVASDCPDVLIVDAAFEKWGTQCFAKLIGDWALSIWNPSERSLILATDPIGPRHLYYSVRDLHVTWSSLLEPIVLCADQPFKLNEEYIAGLFSFFPAPQLTPYVGIHAVPPSSFIQVECSKQSICKYWDFDPGQRILYKTDAEYEEHFRGAFGDAVRRRLRSDTPVLAELSGGMDSSSIVCMADTIIGRQEADTPSLNTVSYFDDSEPNWDERPYFEKVEKKRCQVGHHIDVSVKQKIEPGLCHGRFAVTPGSAEPAGKEFAACILSGGNRVLLSGIGGDEVTGGVPTPMPELEDLLASANVRQLAHQLKVWALDKRVPWFHLFVNAVRRFLPPRLVGVPEYQRPAPWLDPEFVNRQRTALRGYENRLTLFGPLPTFQENLSTLVGLRRQIACDHLPSPPLYEKRYPYLDRSLLEFLYAVPREQLVRPGQRRSLMRRALAGIVPDEILNRKRKAYVSRAPLAAITEQWSHLEEISQQMVSATLGIVDQQRFVEVLNNARQGHEVPLVTLMRTIAIETWLRNHRDWGRSTEKPDNRGIVIATSPAGRQATLLDA